MTVLGEGKTTGLEVVPGDGERYQQRPKGINIPHLDFSREVLTIAHAFYKRYINCIRMSKKHAQLCMQSLHGKHR